MLKKIKDFFNIVIVNDKLVKNRLGEFKDFSWKMLAYNILHFNRVLIVNNDEMDIYIKEEDLKLLKPRIELYKSLYTVTITIYTEKNIIDLF